MKEINMTDLVFSCLIDITEEKERSAFFACYDMLVPDKEEWDEDIREALYEAWRLTRRIDGLLSEWAEDIVLNAHKSGFSGINVVEKILRDPGISTRGSRHKVHWWPRNKRISLMSKAMHQIDPISQVILIIHYGSIIKEDGTVFTKNDLAKTSSIGLRKFNEIRRKAVNKLQGITKA